MFNTQVPKEEYVLFVPGVSFTRVQLVILPNARHRDSVWSAPLVRFYHYSLGALSIFFKHSFDVLPNPESQGNPRVACPAVR